MQRLFVNETKKCTEKGVVMEHFTCTHIYADGTKSTWTGTAMLYRKLGTFAEIQISGRGTSPLSWLEYPVGGASSAFLTLTWAALSPVGEIFTGAQSGFPEL